MRKILLITGALITSVNSYANVSHNKSHSTNTQKIKSIKNLDSLKKSSRTKINSTLKSSDIITFQTKEGTKVLYYYNNSLPIVDVRVLFNAGSARDAQVTKKYGKQLQGTASLTATMLDKGYKNANKVTSENEIASIIENKGIQFSAGAYKDMFIVSTRSLSADEYINQSADLIANTLGSSSFPEDVLTRVKNQRLIGLQQAQMQPSVLASNQFFKSLYGKHPYALPTSGSIKSVNNINTKHLKYFKNKFLVAKNANIAITGNIAYEEAIALANNITAKLPKGKPAKKLPKPRATKKKHIHIDFDSEQTTILAGQLGITKKDPRFYELMIANKIFGGGDFSALLMQELRKKRGYTYGAYSGFSPMQTTGPFTISFSTKNDKATKALKVMKKTLRNYLKKGATTSQISETKETMINQYPLQIATNANINGILAMVGFYDLPLDYIENYMMNLMTPSKHAINNAFRNKVSKNLLIVTVGPKK